MKTLILALFLCLPISLFFSACSDDSINTVNPPPAVDSTVHLISPVNDAIITTANFVDFNWNSTLNSPTYELCVTNTVGAPDCNVYNPIVSDSTSRISGATTGTYNFYWKVRIHNPVNPCPTWSEVRHLTIIVP